MMRLEVPAGTEPPWYYGLAYRRWEADSTVFYPVPLHLIVRWSHRFWWWLRFNGAQNGRYIELRAAFNQGRVEGRKEVEDSVSSVQLKGANERGLIILRHYREQFERADRAEALVRELERRNVNERVDG